MKTKARAAAAALALLLAALLFAAPVPAVYSTFLPYVEFLPPLKGVAGPVGGLDGTHFQRYHNWDVYPAELDRRLARMMFCVPNLEHIEAAARADVLAGVEGRTWLSPNEPDDENQCLGIEPRLADAGFAADQYAETAGLIKSIDPTARVFGGGVHWLGVPEVRAWWAAFLDALEDGGSLGLLDGVHVHVYPSTVGQAEKAWRDCFAEPPCTAEGALAALEDWINDVHLADPRTATLPLWVTETGWLNCSPWAAGDEAGYLFVRDTWMLPLQRWAAANRTPVFWFYAGHPTAAGNFWCTFLAREGIVTPLGEQWASWLASLYPYPRESQ